MGERTGGEAKDLMGVGGRWVSESGTTGVLSETELIT